jgi:hypothetical protein
MEFTEIEPVQDGPSPQLPYRVAVVIEGSSSILFHRWSVESVEAKSRAAKGSTAKKTDDTESYIWRLPNGRLGLPGEYIRMAMIHAAKFRQDPRSPRKSAMDLYKAAIICLTELADLGVSTWDYMDQRRVTVQRNGITRNRPALHEGWIADFIFQVQLPEYVPPGDFHDVLTNAGRIIGVGDFRPTYGRFRVVKFDVLKDLRGPAWLGVVWTGRVRHAEPRPGWVWSATVRNGTPSYGRACWGWVRHGEVRRGGARFASAWCGMDGLGGAWPGGARSGRASLGLALARPRPGVPRSGWVRYGHVGHHRWQAGEAERTVLDLHARGQARPGYWLLAAPLAYAPSGPLVGILPGCISRR